MEPWGFWKQQFKNDNLWERLYDVHCNCFYCFYTIVHTIAEDNIKLLINTSVFCLSSQRFWVCRTASIYRKCDHTKTELLKLNCFVCPASASEFVGLILFIENVIIKKQSYLKLNNFKNLNSSGRERPHWNSCSTNLTCSSFFSGIEINKSSTQQIINSINHEYKNRAFHWQDNYRYVISDSWLSMHDDRQSRFAMK